MQPEDNDVVATTEMITNLERPLRRLDGSEVPNPDRKREWKLSIPSTTTS